jgi:cytosine/adenosine deaminase-related metal-dependent hydrolase
MRDQAAARCCIRGAEVLRSGARDVPERLDVWIEGGRVAALSPAGAAPNFPDAVEEIDGRGTLAIAGLTNAHTHSQSALLQGAVPGEPLDLFVLRSIARRAPRSNRAVEVSATLHAMAMLKRGITSHVDHLRDGLLPTTAGVEAALRAYRSIGIRAAVAPMYEDLTYVDSLPIDQQALPEDTRGRLRAAKRPPPEEYFEVMEELLPRWRGIDGRLDLLLGIDGPQRCTRRLLEMTGEFAARHRIGLHTHLLEAKTQHLMAPAEHGGSFVRYLDQFGLVNERSSLAHFVWCTEDDVALAAERRVNVVHNPVSNLILGSGILPVARLLRAGVNVALGTDGQSGAAVSILEQAKFASLLSRVCDTDPARWVGPRSAFRVATEGGAGVLGLAGELGRIEPGARADIALIDVTGAAWQPRGDVYHHLVMYENGANVRTVLVEGEVVVREGRCVRVNEAEVLTEAESIASRLARENEPSLAAVDRDSPHLMKLLVDALERRSSLNRFADLR